MGRKPHAVSSPNGYVSARDVERIRRAFENSTKSAEQIAHDYGLPSATVVRYLAMAARTPGKRARRVDIRDMV